MPRGEGHLVGKDLDVDASTLLAANDFAYQRMCREVQRLNARRDAGLLPMIERTARFAWLSHPGRLADGTLENILLHIGQTLSDSSSRSGWEAPLPASSKSRTLHIATELYMTGGHSRVLAKWVQRDLSSSHAIIITRQPVELPDYLLAIAAERGAPIKMLDPQEAILERAQHLRDLSLGFDRVVLHHSPDDAVPVLAYARRGGPPVVMFNHAHFWFSLGSGVADLVLNSEPYFKQLTERYRFPRATTLLTGPPGVQPLTWGEVDKRLAKAKLELAPDQPVVMTIANESYFRPTEEADFFATLAKLLSAKPELQVVMVGVGEESALVPAHIRETGRVRLVGRVADPRPYYEAADLCLESFPMPSMGALIEAASFGQAFPVPAFGQAETPVRVNLSTIKSFATRQLTEADYVRHICELIDAPESTRAKAAELRRLLVQQDQAFGDQFPALYEMAAPLGHEPHEIPNSAFSSAPENLVLASMTDIRKVEEALSTLLPLRAMGAAHARALALRYVTPRAAALGIARRVVGPAFRRLPEGLRRRLRAPSALGQA